MLKIRETWVNASEGYNCGDSDWYEPFTEDRGELFRACQREHGRCISNVYVDVPVAFYPPKTKKVGWVFQKRAKYTDCENTYLQETWIELREVAA